MESFKKGCISLLVYHISYNKIEFESKNYFFYCVTFFNKSEAVVFLLLGFCKQSSNWSRSISNRNC